MASWISWEPLSEIKELLKVIWPVNIQKKERWKSGNIERGIAAAHENIYDDIMQHVYAKTC